MERGAVRRSGSLLLGVLLLAGCGSTPEEPPPPKPTPVRLNVSAGQGANAERALHLLVRASSQDAFAEETYDAAARKWEAEDGTRGMVFAGGSSELPVVSVDPGLGLAVYCFFSEPGPDEGWKAFVPPPLVGRYIVDLDSEGRVQLRARVPREDDDE